ncbi:MAG: S-layer homology domain-containing protein [Firmicutes bacterium]|nr:S-layer homology domain-containing protein [Bacillota bacterium]
MAKSIAVIIVLMLSFNTTAYAKLGDNGFEGGISSGRVLTPLDNHARAADKQTYPYTELVLVTGVPIVFSGTVMVTRSVKNDIESFAYSYSLTNGAKNKLTRTVTYQAVITENDNQIIRVMATKQGAKPKETIVIDGTTYSLKTANDYNFSLSTINDLQPACDYYAGNWAGEKIYKTNNGKTITVSMTSQICGYDQYWGATETQNINIRISGETDQKNVYDLWGGSGTFKISSTMSNTLSYIENKPDAISFEGGYLRKQVNNSILTYNINLPLFDSKGIATDSIVNYSDTMSLGSFPQQERLAIGDTSAIKGHWYEENVRQLLSLGIIDSRFISHYWEFENYISRKEFAKNVVESVKITPLDITEPAMSAGRRKNEEVIIPLHFNDVRQNDEYYQYIFTAYKTGIMQGVSDFLFSPNEPLTRAQALVISVRLLGLESIVRSNALITNFNDNDEIPDWARNAVVVASKIELVNGDEHRNLNPNANLTKAEAITLLNNLIGFMRDDMANHYRQ